ncbi:unnamed protein product [Pleuronectes platessa]|uniref:Uncharacterized protein n=1 Tax=Pleuronectes platessa TaxID=8262 RepID=A0A9N7YDS5_PLEPL|nr:unnamed protein product [Pleuronectes platessa]
MCTQADTRPPSEDIFIKTFQLSGRRDGELSTVALSLSTGRLSTVHSNMDLHNSTPASGLELLDTRLSIAKFFVVNKFDRQERSDSVQRQRERERETERERQTDTDRVAERESTDRQQRSESRQDTTEREIQTEETDRVDKTQTDSREMSRQDRESESDMTDRQRERETDRQRRETDRER